ncbi:MAG: hypothetical protein H6732_09200 [Alphaproteobacteria bacterium]|nr:hypothetical protein [Alphaproteobacteria bacterium]
MPEPTVAVAVPVAVAGGSNLVLTAVFVLVVTAAGFLLGRLLGNDKRLLDSVVAGRSAVTDEMRKQAKQVIADLAEGGTSEVLFKLIRQIGSTEAVEALFAGAPLDTLLGLVPELAKAPKEKRDHGDQLLRLLSRIAVHADDHTRMRILGAMLKVTARYRHAVPFMIEICKRVPDAWNDLQPSVEEAASHDPAIARYLRDNANPKEPFVRKATEAYMTSMVRFRRLSEERAQGHAAAVDAELKSIIDREFRFLKMVGAVSRRFVWLPAQAHRFHPLVTEDHFDLLLREAPGGPTEVHALLAQLSCAWAREGQHPHRIRRALSSLEEAAKTLPSAGDALLDVFLGLKKEDANDIRAEQEDVRRRAYFALLEASNHSFEVIKLLGAHGIPRDLYQGSADLI